MSKFKVYVSWSEFAVVEVEADTLEAAMNQLDEDNGPRPRDSEYVNDSFGVDRELSNEQAVAAVFGKIAKIFEEHLGLNPAMNRVVPDAKIVEDLGADSLDVVELIMKIEDEFDIEIPDVDAENLATVGMVVDYVFSHTS